MPSGNASGSGRTRKRSLPLSPSNTMTSSLPALAISASLPSGVKAMRARAGHDVVERAAGDVDAERLE